jgi:CubicO group peptidase (beta-lactamase class C family)
VRLAALVALLALAACAGEGKLPAAKRAVLEERMAWFLEQHGAPGVVVAVGQGQELAWTKALGKADVVQGTAMTEHTVLRFASVSKPITATLAMQLAEAGKLDLDAPIQRYVPSFPAQPWPLTARHLLGHLGGIRDYRGRERESTPHCATLTDALALFAADPLVGEPGTEYRYTTWGYTLLGCAIEAAAGGHFADCVQARVYGPAGITAPAAAAPRAAGYRKVDREVRAAPALDLSAKIPGGGLEGTAMDLVRFAIAWREDRLVKPSTREQMATSMVSKGGIPTGYGCGFHVETREGERVLEHSGEQVGVSAFLVLLPERRLAVAVLCNLEKAPVGTLAYELVAELLR